MRNVCGKLTRLGVCLVVALTLGACGKAGSATAAYPQVVEVRFAGLNGLCSGTIIGANAVLTSQHCIRGHDSFSVLTSRGDFRTENFVAMEQSSAGIHDLAILIFDETIAPPEEIMPLGAKVNEGDAIEIVGFGCNQLRGGKGAFEKRAGHNTIRGVNDFLEVATPIEAATKRSVRGVMGSASNAGACPGDSGGPAARTSPSGELSIVGVTYAIRVEEREVISLFVDLTRNDNRNFLKEADSVYSLGLKGI